MTCPICNGTGEKDHATLSGYMMLDCTAEGCTAATERAALEAAIKAAGAMTPYDERWLAYQAGKAASLEQAALIAEGEQVEDTGTEGDTGYNNAISHVAAAIREAK